MPKFITYQTVKTSYVLLTLILDRHVVFIPRFEIAITLERMSYKLAEVSNLCD